MYVSSASNEKFCLFEGIEHDFAHFYWYIYKYNPDEGLPNTKFPHSQNNNPGEDFHFPEVSNAISQLKRQRVNGTDIIQIEHMHYICRSLITVVAILFNLTKWSFYNIINIWKRSWVIPLYKGYEINPDMYRYLTHLAFLIKFSKKKFLLRSLKLKEIIHQTNHKWQ